MTDLSDDGLVNNYGPPTPAPPKRGRPRAGSAKPVAGPSTKPSSKANTSKRVPTNVTNTIELDEDDEDEAVVEPTKKRRKESEEVAEVEAAPGFAKGVKKGTARVGPPTNGATKSAVAKGKTKADSHVNGATDVMQVDQDEEVEQEESQPPVSPVERPAKGGAKPTKSKNGNAAGARQGKIEQKLLRQVESLREQLDQARETSTQISAQRDKLAKQLEDLHQLRDSEPEQILEDYKAHLQESLRKRDDLIQALESQITRLQSPSHVGSSWTLHFLTRDAAEEEKKALQEENKRLKEALKQRDATILSKDQQIAKAKEESAALKLELDAEIQHSKTLAAQSRPVGPAVTRPAKATTMELRNAPVIKLYEDMTNVLVTNVKFEKSAERPDVDEEQFTCIYTYNNRDTDDSFSLNFTLRTHYDRPDGTPADAQIPFEQYVQKLKYQPKDLEKEPPEVVTHLGFFADAFMFTREQMHVFIKTLSENVTNIFSADEDEGEDGEAGNTQADAIVVD